MRALAHRNISSLLKELKDDFASMTAPALYERIQMLGAMVGLEKVEHPLQFLDIIHGRYVCRRSTLPCGPNGECFTLYDYSQVSERFVMLNLNCCVKFFYR